MDGSEVAVAFRNYFPTKRVEKIFVKDDFPPLSQETMTKILDDIVQCECHEEGCSQRESIPCFRVVDLKSSKETSGAERDEKILLLHAFYDSSTTVKLLLLLNISTYQGAGGVGHFIYAEAGNSRFCVWDALCSSPQQLEEMGFPDLAINSEKMNITALEMYGWNTCGYWCIYFATLHGKRCYVRNREGKLSLTQGLAHWLPTVLSLNTLFEEYPSVLRTWIQKLN